MAYDEKTAQRIRDVLSERHDVSERKMFGGLCFMVNGQMCCGLTDELMVRVGKEHYADALSQPHARPMDFTGRPLAGFVYVSPAGYRTSASLAKWIARGVHYVMTSPPKTKKRASKKRTLPKKRRARR